MKYAVLNKENKKVKELELSDAVFGAPFRKQVLFDCVQAYLANKRLGTQKAKTRGEVHGTTAKMYRQKGTGRARHGAATVNIFVGGGAAFPPTPRSWRVSLPKQMKRKALIQALSLRCKEGNLVLVDQWKTEEAKTKKAFQQLKKWEVVDGLVVIDKPDPKLWRSLRNVPKIHTVTAGDLHALDILRFEKVVLTESAVEQLEKRLV